LDTPEYGRLRLKHAGLHNYVLIKNWIYLMIFLHLFYRKKCISNDDFYHGTKPLGSMNCWEFYWANISLSKRAQVYGVWNTSVVEEVTLKHVFLQVSSVFPHNHQSIFALSSSVISI
jgi:hypothetical protein